MTIPSRGGPYNLPDDVSPADDHFNPPDYVDCPDPDCDGQGYPGDTCDDCDREIPTVEELKAEAAIDAADRDYDLGRGL